MESVITENARQEIWMTYPEARASPLGRNSLGERWSDSEFAEILELGYHPLPSRTRNGVKEYKISF